MLAYEKMGRSNKDYSYNNGLIEVFVLITELLQQTGRFS